MKLADILVIAIAIIYFAAEARSEEPPCVEAAKKQPVEQQVVAVYNCVSQMHPGNTDPSFSPYPLNPTPHPTVPYPKECTVCEGMHQLTGQDTTKCVPLAEYRNDACEAKKAEAAAKAGEDMVLVPVSDVFKDDKTWQEHWEASRACHRITKENLEAYEWYLAHYGSSHGATQIFKYRLHTANAACAQ